MGTPELRKLMLKM